MAERTGTAPSAYATTVVRLFPDYAESVIWFSDPFPYEDTGLTADLVSDLVTWESSYYAGLDAEFSWRTAEREQTFVADGRRLARRLSRQIGDEFEIEHPRLGDEGRRRIRARGPADNPTAAEAFRRRAAAYVERWSEVQRAVARGDRLEWRA